MFKKVSDGIHSPTGQGRVPEQRKGECSMPLRKGQRSHSDSECGVKLGGVTSNKSQLL